MIYKFKDIYNNELYNSCNIVIIAGEFQVFNNIVADKLRDLANPKFMSNSDTSFLSEFEISNSSNSVNTLGFDEFILNKSTYPMIGRWYCNVNYSSLLEKQRKLVLEYIKSNKNCGILVVNCSSYKEYKMFIRNNVLKNSETAHFINLNYPDRYTLKHIITDKLAYYSNSNKVKISDKALDLFIMRLGADYEKYNSLLEVIANDFKGLSIGYDDVLSYIKDIDNYNIDEFIERLVTTKIKDKFTSNRKIYKAYYSLVDGLGLEIFISKLKYKIKVLVEMRYLINTGVVPVLVRYGTKSIQDSLGDNSNLKNLSSFTFKKYAKLANMTSLRDWYYILLMLNNCSNSSSTKDIMYERILNAIIHRFCFSSERLNNDIGIINTLDKGIYNLNILSYSDNKIVKHNFDWEAYSELHRKRNKSKVYRTYNIKKRKSIKDVEELLKRSIGDE